MLLGTLLTTTAFIFSTGREAVSALCRYRAFTSYSKYLLSTLSRGLTLQGQIFHCSINMDIVPRESFSRSVSLVALKIPTKSCDNALRTLKDFVYQRKRIKRIYEIAGDVDKKLLLLDDKYGQDLDLCFLPPPLVEYVRTIGAETQLYSLELGYQHMSVEEVLSVLLPAGLEIPSSFEQAGHIAHLNLRDALDTHHKKLVAQVILDKNPAIRTVVNKIGTIETEFRTFPMEVLAGENNLVVTLKESHAKFSFDFSKVYWNSRLQAEHARVIEVIKTRQAEVMKTGTRKHIGKNNAGIVVADIMAGVGPFAVPLAMANVTVYANDLNPESYKYLLMNAKQNHCGTRLVASNEDGRRFIIGLAEKCVHFDEAVMNLPQLAVTFLDAFVGLSQRYASTSSNNSSSSNRSSSLEIHSSDVSPLPRIHVYSFSRACHPVLDVALRAARAMRCPLSALKLHPAAAAISIVTPGGSSSGKGGVPITSSTPPHGKLPVEKRAEGAPDTPGKYEATGHVVRDVSPNKVIVCLSFTLPHEVASAEPLTPEMLGSLSDEAQEEAEGEAKDSEEIAVEDESSDVAGATIKKRKIG